MSTEEHNEQQENKPLSPEELDAEYDDAWEDDAAHDDEDKGQTSEDEDTDVDDDDDSDDDDSKSGTGKSDEPNDPDTDDKTAGGEGDSDVNPKDPKEVQQEKSWQGRLAKREEGLAQKEAEFKKKQEASRKQLQELIDADDDDTDWDKVAEELEIPEFAALAKQVQKLKQISKTQMESQNAQSEYETEAAQEAARTAHFSAIEARHSDFMEKVQSPEFNKFMESLDPVTKQGATVVLQKGTADQVITLLDKFDSAQKPETKTSKPADALSSTRRGATRPRSQIDMDDYDAGWDEG